MQIRGIIDNPDLKSKLECFPVKNVFGDYFNKPLQGHNF